jgi:hypothetical protein
MPELGSYGSVGAGEGNLSLYPELLIAELRKSAVNIGNLHLRTTVTAIGFPLETWRN